MSQSEVSRTEEHRGAAASIGQTTAGQSCHLDNTGGLT